MGSLTPTFVPARLVGLAVKHPCAFALTGGLPSRLRIPLNASVTLWEATAPVKLPTSHGPLFGLEPVHIKSGISPLAPPPPRGQLQSLPPILRMMCPDPMASCSKAPRGLSVLLRVTCIFTGTSVSPSTWPRQRPSRYAIRAGRNFVSSPPGCDEPTSRCQTPPSMWTLGRNKPVIPGVAFIR